MISNLPTNTNIMELLLSKQTRQKSIKRKAISWLLKENRVLTIVMEGEKVTNARTLCLGHGIIVGYILLRSLTTSYLTMGICTLWFFICLLLCYKIK